MDKSESKAQRAAKRHRNLVAKHAPKFTRAQVQRDRTKHSRAKYPHRVIEDLAIQ